jgi:8-oxo-dGTP pyrophosphatase MutT (NUDIX family)
MTLKSIYLKTLGRLLPSDYFARRYPVSVKGICCMDGKVILLRNERGEWDFPGGKLEGRESLTECLRREIYEELGIAVTVGPLLQATPCASCAKSTWWSSYTNVILNPPPVPSG